MSANRTSVLEPIRLRRAGRLDGRPNAPANPPSGPAVAAILAAGFGCLALGLVTTIAETHPSVLNALALVGPVGSLSGKTTLALLAWLLAWAALHWRWRKSQVRARGVALATLLLIGIGLLGTFPPVWKLFGD